MLTDAQIYEALLESNLDPTKAADLLMASAVMASTKPPLQLKLNPKEIARWVIEMQPDEKGFDLLTPEGLKDMKNLIKTVEEKIDGVPFETLGPRASKNFGEFKDALAIRIVNLGGRRLMTGQIRDIKEKLERLWSDIQDWQELAVLQRRKSERTETDQQRRKIVVKEEIDDDLFRDPESKISFITSVLQLQPGGFEGDVDSAGESLKKQLVEVNGRWLKYDLEDLWEKGYDFFPAEGAIKIREIANNLSASIDQGTAEFIEQLNDVQALLIFHIYVSDFEALTAAFLQNLNETDFVSLFGKALHNWQKYLATPRRFSGRFQTEDDAFLPQAALMYLSEKKKYDFGFSVDMFRRQQKFFTETWPKYFQKVVADRRAFKTQDGKLIPGKQTLIFNAMIEKLLAELAKGKTENVAGVMAAVAFPINDLVKDASEKVRQARQNLRTVLTGSRGPKFDEKMAEQYGSEFKELLISKSGDRSEAGTVDPNTMSLIELLQVRRLQEMQILDGRMRFIPVKLLTETKKRFNNDPLIVSSDVQWQYVTWYRMLSPGEYSTADLRGLAFERFTKSPSDIEKEQFNIFATSAMIQKYAKYQWAKQQKETSFLAETWEILLDIDNDDSLGKSLLTGITFSGLGIPQDFQGKWAIDREISPETAEQRVRAKYGSLYSSYESFEEKEQGKLELEAKRKAILENYGPEVLAQFDEALKEGRDFDPSAAGVPVDGDDFIDDSPLDDSPLELSALTEGFAKNSAELLWDKIQQSKFAGAISKFDVTQFSQFYEAEDEENLNALLYGHSYVDDDGEEIEVDGIRDLVEPPLSDAEVDLLFKFAAESKQEFINQEFQSAPRRPMSDVPRTTVEKLARKLDEAGVSAFTPQQLDMFFDLIKRNFGDSEIAEAMEIPEAEVDLLNRLSKDLGVIVEIEDDDDPFVEKGGDDESTSGSGGEEDMADAEPPGDVEGAARMLSEKLVF